MSSCRPLISPRAPLPVSCVRGCDGDPGGGGMSEVEPIVFVVDDDPSVRRSTERLVRSMGFDVIAFASATEFKNRRRVEGPACLVLDVHLPDLSGLDLQRELAASGVEMPIIFITGRGNIPMSVRAMKEGAVEFLTKPVKSRDLLAAIRAAIERDRAVAARSARDRRTARAVRAADPSRARGPGAGRRGLLNKQIAGELAHPNGRSSSIARTS